MSSPTGHIVEPFRRDYGDHYTGHIETSVLVDPFWVQITDDPIPEAIALQMLMRYAHRVSTPTKIRLVYPIYLEPKKEVRYRGSVLPGDTVTLDEPTRLEDAPLPPALRNAIDKMKEEWDSQQEELRTAARGDQAALHRAVGGTLAFDYQPYALFAEYVANRCDYLLTSNPWLLGGADALREAGCWVQDCRTLIKKLELSLRAAGVFYASNAMGPGAGIEGLGFGTFYPMTDRNLSRYLAWFDRLRVTSSNAKVFAHGRAAFYQRLPFAMYAFDLIAYHAEYAKRFSRDNRYRGDHRFYVAYHMNQFYVMVCGLLDNLAWFWNYLLELGFSETDGSRVRCTLSSKDFRKKAIAKLPELEKVLTDDEVEKWLEALLLKRHPAVHREPVFPQELIEEGTGRVIMDSAHVVEGKDGWALLDLMNHVSYDRDSLFNFLDRMTELEPVFNSGRDESSSSDDG